ncbi:T6SS phospholipase effector Tle1-like catalytic domain-containing protein [Paracidovorax avenae]|uniref:T6SS phospholipase effector Tle1-like catalytic domain-containing protein n=1 Tax=Paracidovorax avenae TaxID=80867 RepID=UPI000D21E0B8|nr:DUF2235 domain-containing protein [Paracidovorax avenae]AVT10050.1 hypothetical protein C8242_11590 [Paracidovorax avenae]
MNDTTEAARRQGARGAGAPTRADILRECAEADARWAAAPGRNLVLLFDGTGNILGNEQDTNVVKLLRMLDKGPAAPGGGPEQLVYYDPGVGTANLFPPANVAARLRQAGDRLSGLALGSGVFHNIAGAYEFLARNYRPGDRIYLLGFSRGAFTARAVAGMVNMYGLVHPEGLPLLDSLVRTYFAPPRRRNPSGSREREDFARDVVENFSLGRLPLVHFVGVWDTVESIGIGLLGGLKITNSAGFACKRFAHVRHAMSLHESRIPYTPRRYDDPYFSDRERVHRSFAQRWFRGVHSDVGGSYARDGLSRTTLRWMADEAFAQGLRLDRSQLQPGDPHTPMHDQAYDCPYWAWAGLDAREREPDDTIDASALPIAAAVPAEHIPRTQPWRTLGWALPVVVALLLAATTLAGRGACVLDGAPGWMRAMPSLTQLAAAWKAAAGAPCSPAALRETLAWDCAFVLAYTLWLPYPMAWALRRLVARAVPRGHRLAWLPRHAHWFMGLLAATDLAENLALLHAAAAPWGVAAAVFCAAKLACLALLAAVLCQGALAGPERVRRDSAAGAGRLH